MNKEEYVLILEALTKMDETDEINKLKEKIRIYIERANLDENYQKEMQALGDRFQKLVEVPNIEPVEVQNTEEPKIEE